MIIRSASELDMAQICDLYNALIPTSTGAWTEHLQTVAERRAWFERQTQADFPTLVSEHNGDVTGFCAYADFRGSGKWPGYRYTVEHTIHVDRRWWGQGIGRALRTTLMEHAQSKGMHVMVAAIDSHNLESIRFHERLGFTSTARMPEVGTKFGRWLELVLMQRILDDRIPEQR